MPNIEKCLFMCTVKSLQHLHLFLVVTATEQLALLDHILFALLQLDAADNASKAFQMEHVVDGAHDQLVGADAIAAAETPISEEQSVCACNA